jgi:uncharacterized membrane protein
VTPFFALLIFLTLVAFVSGQLLLKYAMEGDLRSRRFATFFSAGILCMSFSFFVTLALLQHFDLSYLDPFQGLSVIIVSMLAAMILREKLTVRLLIGTSLIGAGIVLVSLS